MAFHSPSQGLAFNVHCPRKVALWMDFDLTLTKEFTLPYLAQLVPSSSESSTQPTWSYFHTQYMNDLKTCLRHRVPHEVYQQLPHCQPSLFLDPTTPFGQALLKVEHFIIETTPAELWSYERLNQTLYFKDIHVLDLLHQGAHLALQPHVADVFQTLWPPTHTATEPPLDVTICSLNWSSWLILGTLLPHGIHPRQVICNELVFHPSPPKTTGVLVTPLVNGIDKLKCFHATSSLQEHPEIKVYIGDSLQDLPCILTADLGILYVPTHPFPSPLQAILDQAGIQAIPLRSWTLSSLASTPRGFQEKSYASSVSIYYTYDWKEIGATLRALLPMVTPRQNDRAMAMPFKS
ncbi:hypothetical protein HMI55_001708 [Coelomomyces lativittatus]|nr:hypothetical protein HMI55_001708 [Coelomomyces lativittatus]KAJ1507460.1 hypothetical protein HMI56_000090 [Coelomomyces lativittatus]